MKKILTLSVTELTEKFYVAFMLIVLNIIGQFEVLTEKFAYYVNQFKAAYNHLNKIYLKYDLKFYTEEVQKQDNLRTTAFRKLKDMVRYNFTYPADEAKREAARILLEIIKQYDCADISRLGIDGKIAALTNLIEDYEGKYAAQVEAIGVGDLLADLHQAQDKFMEVYLARTEVNSELGLKAMTEARKRMTEAYRDLVTVVNLGAKRDTDGELDNFINMMNVEIRKQFVNTGQSGSSASTGEDGEDAVRTKTATFNFKNGNSIKLKVEVGTILTAPTNTEGYMWKPEVPEFMPEKNCTFKEVAIVPEEATATFHFLNHQEEEIRQLVGSILNAPANTTGCIWKPEVPAVMPAEDTSYYEMQEETTEGNQPGENEQQPGETNPTNSTATFEYRDGRKEEIKAAAGTPLTAPQNTEGYRWKPAVPATMPAEDTTYTEVISTSVDWGEGPGGDDPDL